MEMELAKLTSKGQLTLPVVIRKKLCLQEGDKVVFLMDGDVVRIANASIWATEQGGAGMGKELHADKNREEIPVKVRRRSIPGEKKRR